MGLKEIIEAREIYYLTCLVHKDKITDQGVSGDVLLFVSLFPRYFLKTCENKLNINDYKILLIESELLYEEDNLRTYYNMYYKNPLAVGYKTRTNEDSFMRMFAPSVTVERQDGVRQVVDRNFDMMNCFTTVPNACIKWEDGIPSKHIILEIPLNEYIDADKQVPLDDVSDVLCFFNDGKNNYYNDYDLDEIERLEGQIEKAIEMDAKYGTNEVEILQRQILSLSRHGDHEDDYDPEYYEVEPSAEYLPYDPEDDFWNNDLGYYDDIKDEE